MSDATCKTCPHRSAGKTGRLICVRFPKSQSIEEGYTCGEHPERAPRVCLHCCGQGWVADDLDDNECPTGFVHCDYCHGTGKVVPNA